jgi:hypothetical protein
MTRSLRARSATIAAVVTIAAAGWIAAAPSASAAAGPVVSVGDTTIVEGHTGNRVARMAITLDAPASTNVTVHWQAVTGSATAGVPTQAASTADYKAVSGSVVVKAGTVTKTVSVTVFGDARPEGNETVALTLSSPSLGSELGDASGTITIIDDESAPGTTVSASDVVSTEGDAKARGVSFALLLSRPAAGTTVTYHLAAGTATGGWKGTGPTPSASDFGDLLGAPRTVSFAAKTVQKHITVAVAADLVDEPDEVFTIVIDSVVGAAKGRNGTGTIVDDDPTAPTDFGWDPGLVGSVAPSSTLVGCNKADNRIQVTTSIHLDPSCTYTRGLEITASNLTVDCRGAHIEHDVAERDNLGVQITAPTTVALHDITVRNCDVSKFNNNLRISREGFKDLVVGSEYVNAFSNILIENNNFHHSANSGVFVDGFVTEVAFIDNTVFANGAVGLYVEAGSRGNLVAGNVVEGNGYKDVIPGPAVINFGGTDIPYISTGREGIAIDGSRDNVVRDNLITGNASGGVFLYKNCGEDATKPGHWVRNYGATGNVIRHNTISDGPDGVWVGSRASENQYFFDCTDTPLISDPGSLYEAFLDPASDNTVEYNRIDGMTNAVRVEDDRTMVRGNWISNAERGVLIGTKLRTQTLAQPVTNTSITVNTTAGVTTPYSWIWGKGTTTFSGNTGNGAAGKLVAGTQPLINPWLFFVRFA